MRNFHRCENITCLVGVHRGHRTSKWLRWSSDESCCSQLHVPCANNGVWVPDGQPNLAWCWKASRACDVGSRPFRLWYNPLNKKHIKISIELIYYLLSSQSLQNLQNQKIAFVRTDIHRFFQFLIPEKKVNQFPSSIRCGSILGCKKRFFVIRKINKMRQI